MPTRKNKRLVNHLKEMIDSRGVNASRVAEAINREPSTLSDILRGRRGISDDLMVDLCDYFGCKAGDLIDVLPRDLSELASQK